MTFRASISTNILRIDPSELVASPASHEARRRILAAGDAYQRAHRLPAPVAPPTVEKVDLGAQLAASLAKGIETLRQTRARKARSPAARGRQILAEVAAAHHLKVEEILRFTRRKAVSAARHEACYRIAAEVPRLSYTAIGVLLNIQHTTVIMGLRRHGKRYDLPINFGKQVKGKRIGVLGNAEPATHRP